MRRKPTNETLCKGFLDWAAVHRPSEVGRYTQFVNDFLAHRREPPDPHSGVCRNAPTASFASLMREWVRTFGLFEVRRANFLAESFALDTAVQVADWADTAEHDIGRFQLSSQFKAAVTGGLSGRLVGFTVPKGHKLAYQQIPSRDLFMHRRPAVAEEGAHLKAELRKCHLSDDSWSAPPIEGLAYTVNDQEVETHGFDFVCRALYQLEDGETYGCPSLLPASWIDSFGGPFDEALRPLPASWSEVFAVKDQALKELRRSRRRPPGNRGK